jgi:hypothetical protein
MRDELIKLIADTYMKTNRPGDARTVAEQVAEAILNKFIVLDPAEAISHETDQQTVVYEVFVGGKKRRAGRDR